MKKLTIAAQSILAYDYDHIRKNSTIPNCSHKSVRILDNEIMGIFAARTIKLQSLRVHCSLRFLEIVYSFEKIDMDTYKKILRFLQNILYR